MMMTSTIRCRVTGGRLPDRPIVRVSPRPALTLSPIDVEPGTLTQFAFVARPGGKGKRRGRWGVSPTVPSSASGFGRQEVCPCLSGQEQGSPEPSLPGPISQTDLPPVRERGPITEQGVVPGKSPRLFAK